MINNPKMQLAKKLSLKSTHRFRIGAVIVKKKSIVGVGFNKIWKTHPLISKGTHKKLHAEVDAIIGQSRRHLEGSIIYVYRDLRNGEVGLCKPCVDCQQILKEAGVKKAYYTDPEEKGCVGEMEIV